jgi:predicted alpha/beta superfamily hydrolase
MRPIAICITLAFLFVRGNAQPAGTPGIFTSKYTVDTIHSAVLNENRIIKVYLPPGYNPGNKYPAIYVLDENWMFEPTIAEVIKLANFNVIPPCIVIGINSPNRSKDLRPDLATGAFTEGSRKFNEYLTKEVPQYIASTYTAPVFNILVGHSDGATFAQKAMTSNPDAFRGVICLSQNLWGSLLQEYMNYSKNTFSSNRYFFVASGTRDATSRVQSGMKLDSLFRINMNTHLKVRHELYSADHSGIAGIGITAGITFIFSDYYQPNGWDKTLVDSLKEMKQDPLQLIESTLNNIKANYGVDMQASQSGILDVAFVIITNKDQAKSYADYRSKLPSKDGQFNSSIAQLYEKISEYEIAFEYWIKYLNDPASYKSNFFYFRRPVELLAYKINDGNRAIEFAEKWEKQAPESLMLSFKYLVAKIAADKGVKRKTGVNAINYFIQHYDPAKTQYTLGEAKMIKEKLK